MSEAEILLVGETLPAETRNVFASTGTGGAINLPNQTITMVLHDFRPTDIESFEAPARFRVSLCKSFLLISPSFDGFNFDIVWSPLIAKMTGEPPLERPSPTTHLMFNFILADGDCVVRSIRSATISPDCGHALWRAQEQLMGSSYTGDELQSEMNTLFRQYPKGIPETFFHESCKLGD